MGVSWESGRVDCFFPFGAAKVMNCRCFCVFSQRKGARGSLEDEDDDRNDDGDVVEAS